MFTNVLVGVDGRPTGRDAISLARQLIDPDGNLTLANVRPGALAAEGDEAHDLLERESVAADVDAALVTVVASSPGRGLHRQAEEQNADLLVVGSCSRGVLGRATLGDDTRAALNGACSAVAIAPVGYGASHKPIAKVGVAFNHSPESMAAIAVAQRLAASRGATVNLLHVVSLPSASYTGYAGPAIGQTIDAMLDEARTDMSKLPGVQGRAVHGLVNEELVTFSGDVDLLVVGSRGYGPVRRLVLGSTSEYLARHARCPLLVLPRPSTAGDLRDGHPGDTTGATITTEAAATQSHTRSAAS